MLRPREQVLAPVSEQSLATAGRSEIVSNVACQKLYMQSLRSRGKYVRKGSIKQRRAPDPRQSKPDMHPVESPSFLALAGGPR